MLVASCARPLTPEERAFAASVQGPTLDTARVRIHDRNLVSRIVRMRPPRPQTTCRERIYPREIGPQPSSTAAFVLFERMFVAGDLYAENFLPAWPEAMSLPFAMIFAHEMTHVWQWQNRAVTGYHPALAAQEHAPGTDPYLYDLAPGKGFLDYSFEQQGGLVEEFVCCRALDPDAPRTQALHDLLRPQFPGLARRSPVPPDAIKLPQDAPDPRGICSK
ncbi:hypothetical protein E2L08_16105 [Palleronia sediminis]|uniref:DUF4157 domain-containing protein n=1 Tax=Palleronia sediminis TaxID=2547833 RepID=A0A4R5ZWF3_9RHOB|nr:hypothetical protein E2L08_16105 [Palleronia sediminis]